MWRCIGILLIGLVVAVFSGTCYSAAKDSLNTAVQHPLWMGDIEAIASHPDKIYEVYRGMTWEAFRDTWHDVPGWHEASDEGDTVVFERENMGDIVQTFFVKEGSGRVSRFHVSYMCKDEKTAKRIYNFARTQFTRNYGQAGVFNVEPGQKIIPAYPIEIWWYGERGEIGVHSQLLLLDRREVRITSYALDIASHRKLLQGRWYPDF